MNAPADQSRFKYVFGPVPSRRLGLSLGVDLIPRKVCTLDCVYCQVGRTSDHTVCRGDFVPVADVIREIRDALAAGPRPDYVTMSGSGEPTLNVRLGEVIDAVHAMSDVRVAVITNGTLLNDPAVRRDCSKADLVVPSLDAGDEETYQRINRPTRGLALNDLVAGLETFRREYTGPIWLEVFVSHGINDSDEHIERIARLADRIRPDRIQLNTATRPPAEDDVWAVGPDRLAEIARILGPRAEVIASFKPREAGASVGLTDDKVLAMILRRPVTADDIAAGLAVHPSQVAKALGHLLDEHKIVATRRGSHVYYEASVKP